MVSPYETARMLKEKYMLPEKPRPLLPKTVFVKVVPNASPNADGEWKELPYRASSVPARNRTDFAQEYLCDIPEGYHIVALSFSKPEEYRG